MKRMDDLFCEIFPDCDRAKLHPELRFGDVDGWDSMSAVNFSLEVENVFNVELDGQFFRADQTLGDVLAFLSEHGVS